MSTDRIITLGAVLLVVCLASLTVVTSLRIIPPDILTHTVSGVVGGILGYAAQKLGTSTSSVTVTATETKKDPP